MAIAFLGQFLISFMEMKNIMTIYVNFVWIISNMKKYFSRIMSPVTLKNIFKKREEMVNGETILKFKRSLKFMPDLLKYMHLKVNLFELFMNKIRKK